MSNDGGPAFAMGIPSDHSDYIQKGMTLRDYFAGQALIAHGHKKFTAGPGDSATMLEADWAYLVADAMIEARKEGHS